jgi:hypothetical protein
LYEKKICQGKQQVDQKEVKKDLLCFPAAHYLPNQVKLERENEHLHEVVEENIIDTVQG